MIVIPVQHRKDAPYWQALMTELLTRLPSGVAYLTGPDLVIEFANDAWRRLADDRAMIGLPLRKVMPELVDQECLLQLEETLQSGKPFRVAEAEVLVRRHTTQVGHIFVDFACQPVRDASGTIAGIALYATDVTPHVRDRSGLEALATDLAASEERYRTLFETMPQGIVHYAVDGTIIGVNPAACQILGIDLDSVTSWPIIPEGRAVREDGSVFPSRDMPVPVALRTGKIVSGVIAGFRHGQTGELRWVRITAVPDARDEQGRTTRAYAIFTDLTEQRRAETALRQSTALLGRLRDANVLGVVVKGEDRLYEANDAYLDMIGYTRDDLEAGRIIWRDMTPPEYTDVEDWAIRQLRQAGACQPFEKEYIHRDGHRVPVLIGSAVISQDPFRWTSFVIDLTAQQRAEQERTALLMRARANSAEARSARERLALLMRAGALVAATRDRAELLDEATHLMVPSLADFALAFLPAPDGTLRASAFSHRDPARAEYLATLGDHPISPVGPMLTQRAYSSATTQLSNSVTAEMPAWISAEPGAMTILNDLGAASVIATPMLSPHGPLGVFVLCRNDSRPQFDEADVQMVEELSRRLAVGLANADVFAREHDIAETLQRALLPDALPRMPGLELAVRYLPATEGANVGGDWFDGFPLPDGRIGLVIGDVLGHSITSASIMGQVRSLIRGYAIDDPAPCHVLERANTALVQLMPDALASVVYAVFDPATSILTYANAGHPPPLVSQGTGHAEYLDDTDGTMLGALAGTIYVPGQRLLHAGSRLLFYTDGLIENRQRDITDGLAILAETLRMPGADSAEETCTAVHAALLGTARREDDVCLLTAHLTG